jgi:hypothetical protein
MTLETIHCPSCGAQAALDDAFCAECGGELRPAPAPMQAPPLHEPTGAGAELPGATPMAQNRSADAPAPGRGASFDIAKLDLIARVAASCGLLAFINSFLPWYTVSFEGVGIGSANAWDLDYAWISVLLLLGLGIAVALPAFSVGMRQVISPAAVGAVGAVATIIVVIRWATYPSGSDLGVDAGAGVGTYLGLVLALIVTGFGVRADAAHDRVLPRFFSSFRRPGDHQPPTRA